VGGDPGDAGGALAVGPPTLPGRAKGAAVGAATSHMHDNEAFTPKAIIDTWMPVDDRHVH